MPYSAFQAVEFGIVLARRITNELPSFPADSLERADALRSLRNIQIVLSQRDFSP